MEDSYYANKNWIIWKLKCWGQIKRADGYFDGSWTYQKRRCVISVQTNRNTDLATFLSGKSPTPLPCAIGMSPAQNLSTGQKAKRRGRTLHGLSSAHWASSAWILCCFCWTLRGRRLVSDLSVYCKETFPKSSTIRDWLCKHSRWHWEAIGTRQWITLLQAFMNPAQCLFTVSLIDQEC